MQVTSVARQCVFCRFLSCTLPLYGMTHFDAHLPSTPSSSSWMLVLCPSEALPLLEHWGVGWLGMLCHTAKSVAEIEIVHTAHGNQGGRRSGGVALGGNS